MQFHRICPDPALCAASGAAAGAAALLIPCAWLAGVLFFCIWAVFAPRLRTGIFVLFFGVSLCTGLLQNHFERHRGKDPVQGCRAEVRLTDASLNTVEGVRLPGTILAELRTADGIPERGNILVWFGETAPKPLLYGTVCLLEGELQYRGAAQLTELGGKDAAAKSNKAEFRMDREKDGIRNFELATQSDNGRKRENSGLSRDTERPLETFGSRVYLPSPGLLNFDAYLAARGCRGIFFVRKCRVKGVEPGLFGRLLKGRDFAMNAALDKIRDPRVKNLIAAMFFGCRQGLDPVSRREFSQAGVVHLFAVSGLHVAMLGALLLLMMRGVPFFRRHIVLCILLGLYVLSTGANPPAVRAFCMIGSWCILRSRLLFLPGGSILLWTAAWMLCCRPAQLLDIGFLFSFLTAGALVFGSRWISELRQDCQAGKHYFLAGRRPKSGWGEKLLNSVAGCATAFAAGSFFSLAAFGLFLPGSIFVNLLMIPVTALLFPLLLLKICVFRIPLLGSLCAWGLQQLFSLFDAVTSLGGMLFEPESLSLHRSWALLPVYAGFFGLLGGRGRKQLAGAGLLAAAGLVLALIPAHAPHAELLLISGAANEAPCAVLADPASKFGAVVNAPSRTAVAAAREFLARRGIARAEFAVFVRNGKNASRALENLALSLAPAKLVILLPKAATDKSANSGLSRDAGRQFETFGSRVPQGAIWKRLRSSPGAAHIRTIEGEPGADSASFSSGPFRIFSEKNGWGLVYCNPATDSNIQFRFSNGAWERTAEFRGHGRISRVVLENSSLPEVRRWEDSN